MQRERLYLRDIVVAARALPGFLQGVTLEAFLASDLLRSAVMHKLTIIGEAAANVSADLRARYPEVPWKQIVAFRNLVVHAYFSVDWSIVWLAATRDALALREQVARILRLEFPEGEGSDQKR